MAKHDLEIGGAPRSAQTVTMDASSSVYEALCEKINLSPVTHARSIEAFQSQGALSESSLDERVAQAMKVLLRMLSGSDRVERLDRNLL